MDLYGKLLFSITALAAAAIQLGAEAAPTVYRHIPAETCAPYDAVINSDGGLTEDGVTYACIYKPVAQGSWLRTLDKSEPGICWPALHRPRGRCPDKLRNGRGRQGAAANFLRRR
jgi:hypothetical protein